MERDTSWRACAAGSNWSRGGMSFAFGLGLRVRAVLGFNGLLNRALEGFHQRFSSVFNGS